MHVLVVNPEPAAILLRRRFCGQLLLHGCLVLDRLAEAEDDRLADAYPSAGDRRRRDEVRVGLLLRRQRGELTLVFDWISVAAHRMRQHLVRGAVTEGLSRHPRQSVPGQCPGHGLALVRIRHCDVDELSVGCRHGDRRRRVDVGAARRVDRHRHVRRCLLAARLRRSATAGAASAVP